MIIINPQEIIEKLNTCIIAIQKGNAELKSLGLKKAKAEREYRVALQKEMLRLKTEGYKVTIIPDMARGNETVANLRLNRDIVESTYYCCRDGIKYLETEIDILRSQLAWMKAELNKTF